MYLLLKFDWMAAGLPMAGLIAFGLPRIWHGVVSLLCWAWLPVIWMVRSVYRYSFM